MSKDEQNTELARFKEFINRHPKLIREIRKNGRSWQGIYEQWVLLGEDDIHWEQYKEETEEQTNSDKEKEKLFSKFDMKPDLVKQILKYTESIDINKLQEQVHQLSKTIGTVQEIVNQYQQTNGTNQHFKRPNDWFMD